MTAVLEAVEADRQDPIPSAARVPRALKRLGRAVAATLPWIFPAATWVTAMQLTGVASADVWRYTTYFVFGVVLPGTLVYRALRGSRGNLPEDLGLGAATGLVVLLLGWAGAAATGMQEWLSWWPPLVVLPFLAIPRLWKHWRTADPKPLPLRWSWIIAAAMIVVVIALYQGWTVTPLPPAGGTLYQDVMYHLALVHEMTRSMPFQVPQLAGDTLRYHYLSDADMAAASMLTGIDPAIVLLRLWIVPIAWVTLLATAALARQVSGKWWAGALGGTAGVVGIPLSMGAAIPALGGTPISTYSPSQTYQLPLLALLLTIAVDVLRGRPVRWAWLMIFPIALACAGAKSSALPTLGAGLVAAILVVAIRSWRRLPVVLALAGLIVAATLTGLQIFSGGGASTIGLQPLSILFWFVPYARTVGTLDIIDGNRFLLYGVETAATDGLWFIAAIVAWWALSQTPRILGVTAIVAGRTKKDPVAWMLAWMTAAGVGGLWLLWHPSASQTYFFMSVAPFGAVLTVWLLADQARSWKAPVAGVLAGGAAALFFPKVRIPRYNTYEDWLLALGEPLLRAAVLAVSLALIALAVHRLFSRRFPWRGVRVAVIAAVIGASIVGATDRWVTSAHDAWTGPPPPPERPERAITTEEITGALWLEQNTGRDDIVATNVHCQPIGWIAACDARAFWVAGLGGRRTLIESWGYSDQAVAMDGVDGKRYTLQPAPYPEKYELNERVFTDGQINDLAELQHRYGVEWLFADDRVAGGVSPILNDVADLRFNAGSVWIYELRPMTYTPPKGKRGFARVPAY